MRAGVPIIFGFIPVGIAFAIAARQAGLTVLETVLMSVSVFAGASQMMAAEMWGAMAGTLAIILATLILNLRHVIMSTCVMTRMRKAPLILRIIGAFGVTDESFAIFTQTDEEKCTPSYYFGLITVSYSSWVLGTLIGALGADLLPSIVALSFGVALYAMFISIITPELTKSWQLLALVVLTALANWGLSCVIPESWAMIAATLVGAFVGVFVIPDGSDGAEAAEKGDRE